MSYELLRERTLQELHDGRRETALVLAALLIADELHRANEREHGVGVFRDCLLRAIANIGRNAR